MLHADLLLTSGNLITLDPARPRAAAMAVRDGRIVAVGDDRDVLPLTGPSTKTLKLAGRTVTPGFCDSHLHLWWYGAQLLRQADLVGSASIEEVLSRLSNIAQKHTGWIQGHGFDQDKLAEHRFPTRADLDRVSRDRPIIISRICGHASVVNTAALALVTDEERAAGDAATGRYTEGDSAAFYRRIPPLSEDEAEQAVLAACDVAVRTGITSVHTLLDTPEQMAAYARLRRKGKLPIRVVGMPPYEAVAQLHAHGVNTTFGDDSLRFGAAKLFSDGSLGAQTAWLAEPYTDKPETRGIRMYDPQDLKEKARDAQRMGWQVAIHAIGDRRCARRSTRSSSRWTAQITRSTATALSTRRWRRRTASSGWRGSRSSPRFSRSSSRAIRGRRTGSGRIVRGGRTRSRRCSERACR